MLVVWLLDHERRRRGQLRSVGRDPSLLECTVVLRDADAGSWTLTAKADSIAALAEKNWRVIIVEDQVTVMSGRVTAAGLDVDGTITLSGEDDTALLAAREVYPDPRKSAEQQSDAAYWKRSGPAGTVLDELIYRNLGRGGIAARAVDRLYMDGNYSGVGLGSTVHANLRYKNLLEAARELARAGGVTFWAMQAPDSTSILVRFRIPQDRSRRVRFTRGAPGTLGGLVEGSFEERAATVTSVLVAGQGQGADRTIKEHTIDPGPGGLRIEKFQDRRDTDDPAELEQAGTGTLAEGAAAATATVKVEEVPGLRLGVDYQLGDTVLVDFGTAKITEPVRTAEISWDGHSRTVSLSLGDHDQADDQAPAWVKYVRQILIDLRIVQAN